jgi:hypothetical protein
MSDLAANGQVICDGKGCVKDIVEGLRWCAKCAAKRGLQVLREPAPVQKESLRIEEEVIRLRPASLPRREVNARGLCRAPKCDVQLGEQNIFGYCIKHTTHARECRVVGCGGRVPSWSRSGICSTHGDKLRQYAILTASQR